MYLIDEKKGFLFIYHVDVCFNIPQLHFSINLADCQFPQPYNYMLNFK